jgi:hypothetical protein
MRGRPPKYPWEIWTDGERHFLKSCPADEWSRTLARDQAELGEDLYPDNVKVASMRAECHAAARRKGGKADTQIMGTTVIFKFIEG